jgi:hypothetical protein
LGGGGVIKRFVVPIIFFVNPPLPCPTGFLI